MHLNRLSVRYTSHLSLCLTRVGVEQQVALVLRRLSFALQRVGDCKDTSLTRLDTNLRGYFSSLKNSDGDLVLVETDLKYDAPATERKDLQWPLKRDGGGDLDVFVGAAGYDLLQLATLLATTGKPQVPMLEVFNLGNLAQKLALVPG